jgi:uncharacterized RDD family membrane protein YckC
MKCEICGNELIGASIICRACNHNNAMKLVSDWRAKQEAVKEEQGRRPLVKSANNTIEVSKEADPNLLSFPTSLGSAREKPAEEQTTAEPETGLSDLPPWRAQVKEKVRQIREKRLAQSNVTDAMTNMMKNDAPFDQNPIVEAALNRIRRSSTTPSIPSTARTIRQSNQATALAEAFVPEPEIPLKPEPPDPRRDHQRPSRIDQQISERSTKQYFKRAEREVLTPKPSQTGIETTNEGEGENRTVGRVKTLSRVAPAVPMSKARTFARQAVPAKVEIQESKREPEIKHEGESAHLLIETKIMGSPEVVSELTELALPASLWVRTLAGACDFEIIALAYLPIFAAYATLNTSLGNEAFFILLLLLSAVILVYQSVTLFLAERSFGMALLNMKLVNTLDASLPITRRQKLLRACAATIAFLCPPLNFIVMRLNRQNLSLPDLVSGTSPLEE